MVGLSIHGAIPLGDERGWWWMGLAVETAPEGRRAAPPRNPPSRVPETYQPIVRVGSVWAVRAGGLRGRSGAEALQARF